MHSACKFSFFLLAILWAVPAPPLVQPASRRRLARPLRTGLRGFPATLVAPSGCQSHHHLLGPGVAHLCPPSLQVLERHNERLVDLEKTVLFAQVATLHQGTAAGITKENTHIIAIYYFMASFDNQY